MTTLARTLFFAAAACFLATQGFAAAPAPSRKARADAPKTVEYKVTMQSKLYGRKGAATFRMKGDKLCWDRMTGGGLSLALIKNDDGLFLVDRTTKRIGRYPSDSPRKSPMQLLPGPYGDVQEFLKKMEARKGGESAESGRKCDVWSYTEPETKWNCELHVDRKTKTPAKLVMTGSGAKSDTVTVTYDSYKLGVPVADSVFKLPSGYAVRDMPTSRSLAKPLADKPAEPKAQESRTAQSGPDTGYSSGGGKAKPEEAAKPDEKKEGANGGS